MKIWHRFQAWILERRINREHRELHKYVRRSAYEINAWKEDISFLEERRREHRAFFEQTSVLHEGKVVSIDEAHEARPKYEVMPSPQPRSVVAG